MIFDYILGQTNGLDILQKAGQLDHKLRIIMLSGYQSLPNAAACSADVVSTTKAGLPKGYQANVGPLANLPKRAKELGASAFLPKPFLMQELLNAVGTKRRS